MKRRGQITYELEEQEYTDIKMAIDDILYYFEYGEYRDDAERGIERLKDIFED